MKKLNTIIIISILTICLPSAYGKQTSSEIIFPQTIEDEIFIDPEQPEEQIEEKPQSKAFFPLNIDENEIVFNTVTKRIDSIDPSFTASYYPGGRGANKLVIYTPNYGIHTGTNEFGTEAIVEENTVTLMSGADSTIPKNGLVISGHGSAKTWINNNITIGSKIYVDIMNRQLTVYTTSQSYTFEAKEKIAEASSMIDYYKNNFSRYNSEIPENYIRIAKNYLQLAENEKKDSSVIKQYTKEAIDSANMAIKTALPYVPNELKGTWIRPTETSEEQIISTLDNIKSNGFNNIFLETYFHGKTIFPSKTMNKYGFTIQNETFEGFDPLKVWINEAHKRGIKVHIWFQSFYVGNKHPQYDSTSILAIRPDWGNKTKQYANCTCATKSVSEHNGYFIDPANPEVQDFLIELLDEIITSYKPDGINLDYIRYPNSAAGNTSGAWGYTEYARNEFSEIYGLDPLEISAGNIHWYDWNQYRRNKITKFVKRAGELGKEKNVYISTVIFPDIASALATKQQDWRTWSECGYINGFTPLFLTYDSKMLVSMMNDVTRIKSPSTQLYAGLFVTFMGGTSEDLIRQIYETRRLNADGVILFDWAHTGAQYTSTLIASAFNEGKTKNTIAQRKSKKKVAQKKEERKEQKMQYPKGRVITTTNSKGAWVFTRSSR